MEIAKGIFEMTKSFPENERYGLTHRSNRSGSSIPSNIAEGAYRGCDKEFARFLDISAGSSAEAKIQFSLSFWSKYISEDAYNSIIEKINSFQKMTRAFRNKLVIKNELDLNLTSDIQRLKS